jgi:hypothetical protein
MSSSKGYTEKKVLAAIKGSGGIITTIANRIGCEWHTAKKLTQKWQSTRDAYKDERETILDMSESAILKSIKEGNTQDAKWLLSSLGASRGFGKEQGTDKDEVIARLTEIVTKITGKS